jgi:hypothetical protein
MESENDGGVAMARTECATGFASVSLGLVQKSIYVPA